MRKFSLTNANGETFDLMQPEAFLHDPAGLGFGTQADWQRAGDAWAAVDQSEQQPAVTGELVFADYAAYERFLRFARVGGLTLGYCPLQVWQYLDGLLTVEKGEIDAASRRLICPMSFAGASPWYIRRQEYRTSAAEGGKRYAYGWPYAYRAAQAGSILLRNGSLPGSCRIHIFGPVRNPVWTLYTGSGRHSSGRLNGSVLAGRQLIVDGDPLHMELAEYTADGVFAADRYQDSDFSTERFLTLPPGESRLVLSHDGLSVPQGFVEVTVRV